MEAEISLHEITALVDVRKQRGTVCKNIWMKVKPEIKSIPIRTDNDGNKI